MKNIRLFLTGSIFLLTLISVNAEDKKHEPHDRPIHYRIEEITQRVEEIKALDKSEMTSLERREIKKELKELKREAREMGLDNRISISVGALIIIILLVIIIF